VSGLWFFQTLDYIKEHVLLYVDWKLPGTVSYWNA
jgi:hypothetical protein